MQEEIELFVLSLLLLLLLVSVVALVSMIVEDDLVPEQQLR